VKNQEPKRTIQDIYSLFILRNSDGFNIKIIILVQNNFLQQKNKNINLRGPREPQRGDIRGSGSSDKINKKISGFNLIFVFLTLVAVMTTKSSEPYYLMRPWNQACFSTPQIR
jgi:hypothetical protein